MDREALFNDNLAWAEAVARKVHRALPPSFDLDDLKQEALLEHWRRCQSYDEACGVPYQGYGYCAVRGAVLMKCRRRHYLAATAEELDPGQVDTRPSAEQELLDREDQRNRTGRRERHRKEWFRECIAAAPAADAYLLKRVYVDGVDLRELSKLWQSPYVELSRRLAAAVRRLKRVRNAA